MDKTGDVEAFRQSRRFDWKLDVSPETTGEFEQSSFPAPCCAERFRRRSSFQRLLPIVMCLATKTNSAAWLSKKTPSVMERSYFQKNPLYALKCTAREIFSEADFEAQDGLHSKRGDMSENAFTYPVLSVNVQLFLEHEHYKNTVNIPKGITVV